MASHSRVLYIGMTNDLRRRVHEHRRGQGSAFTRRYRATRLVYFESTGDVLSAIAREKVLKGWVRRRKIDLIELQNPGWNDLSAGWK